MNQLYRIIALAIVIMVCCSTAFATKVVPRADVVFESASIFLSGSKKVVIDCTLYGVYDRISVTNVWLEKNNGGEWTYVKKLTPPTYVAYNMADYGAEVDYSSAIGTGTFRVGFTVDADGYAISRYSNTRTF